MITEGGKGDIDTSSSLPDWFDHRLQRVLQSNQKYRIPYHLDPEVVSRKSQEVTQYQLYSLFDRDGNCYSEVNLRGKGRIDLVWHDTTNDRVIGIEVKSLSEYEQKPLSDLRDQIKRYRSYTPIDTRLTPILENGTIIDAEELYLFDAIWVALPRNKEWPKDGSNRVADGWLTYDYLSGTLSYEVSDFPERETVSSTKILKNNVGRESELVTTLWKYYRSKNYIITSEVGFNNTPQVRNRFHGVSDLHVRHQLADRLVWQNRRADLIVGNKHVFDGITNGTQICGIEVKTDLTNWSSTIEQLRDYVRSKLFSKVYLALPESQFADAYEKLDQLPNKIGFLAIRTDASSGSSVRELRNAEEITLDTVPYNQYEFRNGEVKCTSYLESE
jgi:hypothetical protein